jgi:curli production assembly/transport component CsgG/holdfast attachment protein HfaB
MGANMYVMNVGLDLRLVDTNTLEVVDVVSYQKQIIGRQIQAGVFDFLGHTFFDASLGESALEPIQLAVRSVIERAVFEMVARLYHAPTSACSSNFGTSADPLAGPDDHRPNMPRIANTSTTVIKENHYAPSRQEPYHGYSNADPVDGLGLRGQQQ